MSRSGYVDDGDNWSLIKWRGVVASAIRGKRGQALLREMVDALDAMPVRELAAEVFVSGENMCAMGVVARARGVDEGTLAKLDEHDRDAVGDLLDIAPAPALAVEIAYENDEWADGDDEDRWRHMRKWAESNLVKREREREPTPTGRCSWCCKVFTLRDGVINSHDKGRCPGVGLPPFVAGGTQQ